MIGSPLAIIGSPLAEASWNKVDGAYYTGLGSGELFWLVVSIVMCVVALWVGGRHEADAYRRKQAE